jgi:hypothetical protein
MIKNGENKMTDGKDCNCAAYGEHECACGADWTPQEVYDLRKEKETLIKIANDLCEIIETQRQSGCLDAEDTGSFWALTSIMKQMEIKK